MNRTATKEAKMKRASALRIFIFGFTALCLAGQACPSNAQQSTDHGYNYQHTLPKDYVYRTDQVVKPDDHWFISDWWTDLVDLFSRKPAAESPQYIPAEQAMELKLRVRELARQLLDHAQEPAGDYSPLIVTTFVNLNRLYRTSGLGRAMAEQMISELQRAGIEVIDVRMTPSIQIAEGFGEYTLSRDMNQLNTDHNAHAVVAGTYTVSDGQVMINARLLQQDSGLVLSSGSIIFPANRLVQGFLRDEAMPAAQGTMVGVHNFDEIAPAKYPKQGGK